MSFAPATGKRATPSSTPPDGEIGMAATPQTVTQYSPTLLSRSKVAGDDNWRRLTEAANQAYAANNLQRAFGLYCDAMEEAERLFALASQDDLSVPVPVIYNISCHNLAEIAHRSGDESAAEGFLVRAYDKLLTAAASPGTPLQLRLGCIQHLKHALTLLVRNLKHRGASDESIAEYVERAKTVAVAVFHASKHAELSRADCEHCSVIPS
jgi:hypothetical protein